MVGLWVSWGCWMVGRSGRLVVSWLGFWMVGLWVGWGCWMVGWWVAWLLVGGVSGWLVCGLVGVGGWLVGGSLGC